MDVLLDCAPVLKCSSDHNIIWCKTCLPQYDPSCDGGKTHANTVGLFRYNFSEGINFQRPQHVPRVFSQLKDALKSHLSGKKHRDNTAARSHEEEREARRSADGARIAKNVLRIAYKVLFYSLPHAMFETMVFTNHLNGARVGDICHSATQMQRYRKAFCDEVLNSVANHIAYSPCVALVADKVTVMHRTIDITAMITLVPHAPPESLIQAFILGAPVVADSDGSSLAEEWLATARASGINSAEKLSAICTDGQYHHGSVPSRFLKLLQDSESDYAKRSKVPSVPCLWDGAHLLQLADGDARKSNGSCAWVSEVVGITTRVNRRFKYGKPYEEFLRTGKALGVKTRAIQLWSETRFAPHAANVVQAFVTNMPVFIATLEAQLESSRLTASVVTEIREDIKTLKGGQ